MSDFENHPFDPLPEPFQHQEFVQFGYGEVNLLFRTPGDMVILGPGSKHSSARNFSGENKAWILTKTGRRFGITDDMFVDVDAETAEHMPPYDIEVVIGERLNLPGYAEADEVTDVLLAWKVGQPGHPNMPQSPSPFSPFEYLFEVMTIIKNRES